MERCELMAQRAAEKSIKNKNATRLGLRHSFPAMSLNVENPDQVHTKRKSLSSEIYMEYQLTNENEKMIRSDVSDCCQEIQIWLRLVWHRTGRFIAETTMPQCSCPHFIEQ
jgi:hypothetical protein